MNLFKRSLAVILLAVMMITVFSACNDSGGNTSSTSSNATGSDQVDADDIRNIYISKQAISLFDADNKPAYRIIRSSECSATVKDAALNIYRLAKKQLDIKMSCIDDSTEKGEWLEILVGDTNREESKKAAEILEKYTTGKSADYAICLIDNSVCIVGYSDESVAEGAKYFAETYLKEGTTEMAGGICYTYNAPASASVTICGTDKLKDIKIIRPIYNVGYLTEVETGKLIDYLHESTGYKIEEIKDQVARNDGSYELDQTPVSECEIIIGNCKRDGVNVIADKEKYEIRIEGKKIYINGGSPYATSAAVTVFTDMVKNNKVITDSMSIAEGDYKETVKNYDSSTYLKLTWQDEFEGEDFDPVWYMRWDETAYAKNEITGKQPYRGSSKLKNNYVKDSCLVYESIETADAYYGGGQDTRDHFAYQYGYLEISSLHPKGRSFWTAFWMGGIALNGDEYYGTEIDLEEAFGEGTWIQGNTYAWPRNTVKKFDPGAKTIHVNNKYYALDERGFWLDFHTYGYWALDNKTVKFTCDGVDYVTQSIREGAEQMVIDQPLYLRIGSTPGANERGGTPSDDPWEWENSSTYYIDWIEIYQLKGMKQYAKDATGTWRVTRVQE